MIIQGSPEILQGPRGLNNQFGAFAGTDDTVVQLYQQILQRTPSASEIAYWSAGWGGTVEASEIADFQRSAEPERIAADAWRAEQAAKMLEAARQQQMLQMQELALEIEAANRKAIADAYAAAQAAAAAEARTKTAAAAALRERAIAAVKALYLQVLGREGEQTGLDYFADKFGEVVDPDELQIFKNMAQPEIDARNKYLADMAAKSAKDAADAKAIADQFAKAAADEVARQAAVAAAATANTQLQIRQAAEAAAAAAAAAAAQLAANEAANKKAVADAYAAAQAAAAAEAQTKTAAAAALRERAIAAVKALYLQVLGREGEQTGLDYFADRFGDVIDPDELQIFKGMAQPEIDARNAYLADMAAKSAKDAADAKAIADQFAKASADEAARQAAAAAAEAAKKKAIADAYAAAQAAAKAEEQTRTAAAAAKREQAIAAVQILYFQVLGREGDQAGIDYFADKFGEVVDPDELQIFSDMAKPEIDARNAYLADMAKKSAEDAAKAKAIADEFKRVAEDAKRVSTIDPVVIAEKATADGCPPGYAFDGERCRPTGLAPPTPIDILQPDPNVKRVTTPSSGINPALILAAAAAAFFIGG